MELWNDFEGKVVDDRFRLGKLLAPKGRSAFFLATTLSGEPITMRLIESLNDEDEILSRWRRVEGIREEHLQGMAASGQTVLDGTHLVYAVLEPTDMSLDEVLQERALTGEEARQMAGAVVAGLEALHRAGLVHEHVDASSVLARGETVKLRSDCVREMPEGAEGEALRRRDAHDLAMLVGYALTRQRDAAPGTLPRQFEDLVRNGMSGTWGMKEMSALLRPATATAGVVATPSTGSRGAATGAAIAPGPTRPALVGSKAAVPVKTPAAGGNGNGPAGAVTAGNGRPGVPVMPGAGAGVPAMAGRVPGPATGGRLKEVAAAGVGIAAAGSAARSTTPSAVASAPPEEDTAGPTPERGTGSRRVVSEPEEAPHRFAAGPWIAAGVVALVLLLLIVHFARGGSGTKTAAPTPVAVAPNGSAPVASSAAVAPVHPVAPVAAEPSGAWRVIAFTYLHRDQAQHKVDAIAARRPELQAEVFSPNGREPFLVSLGGWMTEHDALALRARARHEGLPRDTFARNYHRH